MKMKYIMAISLLCSAAAMADSEGNNGNHGNHGSSKSTATAVSKSNAKASASINTNNVNSHNNTNNNTNNNTATGGNATATGGNATSTSNAEGGSATGGNASNGGQSVVNQAKDIPVTTAYAASLTSGIDTCLGSGSAGVQTMVVGLSGGKTYVDHHCEMIKDVQLLTQMHLDSAACFRARAGDEGKAIDAAMKAAGVDCTTYGKPEMKPVPVATVEDKVVTPIDAVTHEELNNVIKKALVK